LDNLICDILEANNINVECEYEAQNGMKSIDLITHHDNRWIGIHRLRKTHADFRFNASGNKVTILEAKPEK
jgi:hypothetical protein